MIKLSDHVIYREYHDQTFIIDTKQHQSFCIKAPVCKLLDLFAAETTAELAKEQLAAQYPDVPRQVLSDDVDAAAAFLANNRLLDENGAECVKVPAKEHTNTRFFQRYTIREKLLYSVLFEVTYRCPERCIHCYLEPSVLAKKYVEARSKELAMDEIKDLLDQLAYMNVMDLTFTGGEPFEREDMFEILEYASNRRFSINLFSNAILLTDSGAARLSKLAVNCFHSSIYSHIPETHDRITGVNGSWKKTVHILRELSKLGVYTNFKFVLMEQNKDDFPGVVELAKSIGASVQLISSVSPSARRNKSITSLGLKSDDDLKRVVRMWNEISDYQSYAGAFSLDDPICEAGRNSISIDPYGAVTPCNAFRYVIGNIRQNAVSEIWNHSKKLKKWQSRTKRDLHGCKDCAYISRCSFCPGVALNLSGNMLKRYGEACRQAKVQFDSEPMRQNFQKKQDF